MNDKVDKIIEDLKKIDPTKPTMGADIVICKRVGEISPSEIDEKITHTATCDKCGALVYVMKKNQIPGVKLLCYTCGRKLAAQQGFGVVMGSEGRVNEFMEGFDGGKDHSH